MFGLFKKKDKHDQAVELIRSYFRMPFFDPASVEFYREMVAMGRQELTKEDLAVLYICFSMKSTYWVSSDSFDPVFEREASGALVNLAMAVAGIQKTGVQIDRSVLEQFKELVDDVGVREKIKFTGIQL